LRRQPIHFLKDAIGGKPDGVFDPFAFELLVDIRTGKACVGTNIRK
jgi:hypothetical protein